MRECINKDIGRQIDRYFLELLSSEEVLEFEQHMLECDFCASQVEQFEEISSCLVHSKSVKDQVETFISHEKESTEPDVQDLRVPKSKPWWKNRIIWAAAAVLVLLLIKPWQIRIDPTHEAVAGERRVAILPIGTSDIKSKWLGEATSKLVYTDLSESKQLTIVTGQHVSDVLQHLGLYEVDEYDSGTAVKVAEETQSQWVLFGRVRQSDPTISIKMVLLDVSTGDTVKSEILTADMHNDLFSMVDWLSDSVRASILQNSDYSTETDRPVADITTRSPDAYRHYLEGVSFYEQMYFEDAESSFVKAISYDSTFAMAYYYLSSLDDEKLIKKALKYANGSSRQEQHYIKSLAALLEGDTAAFFGRVRTLIDEYPLDAKAYYWYARTKKGYGNGEEALEYFNLALEIDPYYKRAYNNLAYIYQEMGDYEKAIWAVDMYIAISPDEANPYDTRGDIQARMGEFDQAIESYQKAYKIKPTFQSTANKLADLYFLKREYKKAEMWYTTAWSQENRTGMSPSAKVRVMVAQGKFEETLAFLDKLLLTMDNIPPEEYAEAAIKMFRAHLLNEKDPLLTLKELEHVAELLKDAPQPKQTDLKYQYVYQLASVGLFHEADSIMASLDFYIDSSNIEVHRHLLLEGCVELERGNIEDALEVLKRAINLKPSMEDFIGRYLLAVALIESGRPDEAIVEINKQLKSPSEERLGNPVLNAKIHFYMGRAYEDMGNYELAIEQYEHFLLIWAEADWEISELEDARLRLENLQSEK
jgi:tetratricopeptide (TPR) repeat protein/TolB-like protein